MKNECLDAVLRELERRGIRPTVHNDRKHLLVEWDLPSGGKRQYTLPTTPSDRRAWLNARAEVRRMLKRDGLQNGPQKGLLEKALELPLPITPETREEELIRLREDVEALIDIVLDQKQPIIELRVNGIPMKLEPIEPATVKRPTTAPITRTPGGRLKNGALLDAMVEGEWVRSSDLAERTGMSRQSVSASLNYWTRKGLLERQGRKVRKIAAPPSPN
jgi:hypothetical protein